MSDCQRVTWSKYCVMLHSGFWHLPDNKILSFFVTFNCFYLYVDLWIAVSVILKILWRVCVTWRPCGFKCCWCNKVFMLVNSVQSSIKHKILICLISFYLDLTHAKCALDNPEWQVELKHDLMLHLVYELKFSWTYQEGMVIVQLLDWNVFHFIV